MGDGLGGEVAWLKILTIGRTAGVYQKTRLLISERSQNQYGQKLFRF